MSDMSATDILFQLAEELDKEALEWHGEFVDGVRHAATIVRKTAELMMATRSAE